MSNDDDVEDRIETDANYEEQPNWPGALVMIVFFVSAVLVCGICAWTAIMIRGD